MLLRNTWLGRATAPAPVSAAKDGDQQLRTSL
jgi:hypothetical protein